MPARLRQKGMERFPGPKVLFFAAGFLLTVLLGLLAACLGGCAAGSTGPMPPKQAQGCRADSPESHSSAWRPCGSWFALPGAHPGCHPV